MNLELKARSPWGDETFRPHKPLCEYLSIDRASRDGRTVRSHYVGGRGCAKTTGGILLALRAALEWNIGLPGLWTEPTHDLCRRVFFREFEKIVPKGLYVLEGANQRIRFINGSAIDVCSRNVDNPSKEMGKGPNYAWAIDDEAANHFDPTRYWDIDASIRDPKATHRFHDTLSTPQMNEYHGLCTSHGHNMVNATSHDNPWLASGFAESLAESLDPLRAQQEIYGKFVAQSGRIWDNAITDKLWPHGNLHSASWNPDAPWILACDLGVQSAWLVIQRVAAYDQRTRQVRDELVDVVVAQYLPDDGDTVGMLEKLDHIHGKPSRVYVGADLGTRSSLDGATHAFAFRRQWGAVPVHPITGDLADKSQQLIVAKARLCNALGERRLCVSSSLRSDPVRTPRGILQMLEGDQWASGRGIRSGEWLPKDKRTRGKAALEDVRDALLYGMVGLHPPRFVQAVRSAVA